MQVRTHVVVVQGTVTTLSSITMIFDKNLLRAWTDKAQQGWPSSPVQFQNHALASDKARLSLSC